MGGDSGFITQSQLVARLQFEAFKSRQRLRFSNKDDSADLDHRKDLALPIVGCSQWDAVLLNEVPKPHQRLAIFCLHGGTGTSICVKAHQKEFVARRLSMTYHNRVTKDPESRSAPPLKMLRDIIDLSQSEFARVTGLNINTIRALEIGRRAKGQLSNEQETVIFMSIGASWDPEIRQWVFALGADFGRPIAYTREHYDDFRKELTAEARERAGLTLHLVLRLMSFLESLPPLAVNGWFWRVDRKLDEYGAKTRPYMLSPQWDRTEARMKGYRKVFPAVSQEDEKLLIGLFDRAKAERETQIREGIFDEPAPGPKVVSGRKLTLTPQQHEAANLIARQSRRKLTERSPRKPAAG